MASGAFDQYWLVLITVALVLFASVMIAYRKRNSELEIQAAGQAECVEDGVDVPAVTSLLSSNDILRKSLTYDRIQRATEGDITELGKRVGVTLTTIEIKEKSAALIKVLSRARLVLRSTRPFASFKTLATGFCLFGFALAVPTLFAIVGYEQIGPIRAFGTMGFLAALAVSVLNSPRRLFNTLGTFLAFIAAGAFWQVILWIGAWMEAIAKG